MLFRKRAEYKVKGYFNRWGVVDTYKGYALLENNSHGDETCYLVVDTSSSNIQKRLYRLMDGSTVELPTFMSVVCETYDDLITALADEGII